MNSPNAANGTRPHHRRSSGSSPRTDPSSRRARTSKGSQASIDYGQGAPMSRSSSKTSYQSSLRPASTAGSTSRQPRAGRFSQNQPMTAEGIQQALELHRRSCNIFRAHSSPPDVEFSPSYSTIHPQRPSRFNRHMTDPSYLSSTTPPRLAADDSRLARPTPPTYRPTSSSDDRPSSGEQDKDFDDHQPVEATIMHWTSDKTRRREYAEIDRDSRGLRGVWHRLRPRWWGTEDSRRTHFFDGDSDDDKGSVRRYRMDLDGGQDEETDEMITPDTSDGFGTMLGEKEALTDVRKYSRATWGTEMCEKTTRKRGSVWRCWF